METGRIVNRICFPFPLISYNLNINRGTGIRELTICLAVVP